ncbi:MAG: hypothetical protein M3362_22360 [Acidobacteriota bacterium]|nr:hypothetical protein [Acidobacteriota bacterium]
MSQVLGKSEAMLDEPTSASGWISSHWEGVVTLAVMVVGWIVTFARYGFRLSALERENKELKKRLEVNEEDLCEHISNTRRHIDPERDERRWQDLKEHLARIEGKIERRR